MRGANESEQLLWFWINEGWRFRQLRKESKEDQRIVKAQIEKEMKLIVSKGFVDYFLMVSDIIRWAKANDILVGPGRGSAAASYVCWILRITEVYPLPYPAMVFERFIDESRNDLPDIDIDFDDDRRHEVQGYIEEKYGKDRVGNIGTFQRYRGKNSLDDVARVYRIPKWEVDKVKDLIVERSGGDARFDASLEDTVAMFPQAKDVFDANPDLYYSFQLEGNLKGFGIHAAGIVVGAEPLNGYVATYAREDPKTKRIRQVLSVDKYDGDHIGMLKLDALGLTTMGMLRMALEMADLKTEDLYKIPMDDPQTLKGFHDADVTGIFQFEGRALRQTTEQMKPNNFHDLAAINALSRPGPLHSGTTGDYLSVREGRIPRQDLHPLVTEITKETEGQIIYQEQILRICREIGNFPWTAASAIRKIISNRQGESAFNSKWQEFADGAASNGVSEQVAKDIWARMVTAGSYAFNSAHCTTGDTGIMRPSMRSDQYGNSFTTMEQLWRAANIYERGIGGRYTRKFTGPCVACDREDTKETYVGGQCRTCYHLRKQLPAGKLRGLSVGEDGVALPNVIEKIFNNGPQQVWKITLADGTVARATGDHRYMTETGWSTVDSLSAGSEILRFSGDKKPWTRRYGNAEWNARKNNPGVCDKCGSTKHVEVSHKDQNASNDTSENLWYLCRSCHMKYDEPRISWSKGWTGKSVEIESIEKDGVEDVYTLQMSGEVGHSYMTTDHLMSHNCYSYSMLGFWCMWLKVHHPVAFYTAQLRKTDHADNFAKVIPILRDMRSDKFGRSLTIVSPDLNLSGVDWEPSESGVVAGFSQIPGIGKSYAEAIVAKREELGGFSSWEDLILVKGIGAAKMEKIRNFALQKDPFRVDFLKDNVAIIKKAIADGDLAGVPIPNTPAEKIPYDPVSSSHTIIAVVKHKNFQDLYENHRSRTGFELDPNTLDRPELAEYITMFCEDDTGPMTLKIDRMNFPRMKSQVLDIKLSHDFIVARCQKTKMYGQTMRIKELWVVEPDDPEEIDKGETP